MLCCRTFSLQPTLDVCAYKQLQIVAFLVMPTDFVLGERKGRPIEKALVVLVTDQQLRRPVGDLDQVCRVSVPHGFRKRHQSGSVINRVDWAEHAAGQAEYVADKDVDAVGAKPTD